MNKNILRVVIGLGYELLLYYFMLPAINLRAPEFYSFIVISLVGCFLIKELTLKENLIIIKSGRLNKNKSSLIFGGVVLGVVALILVINLFNAPLFRANAYYKRISVSEGDFSTDVELVDFNRLALLDKSSSQKLGDKVMGQMTDLVSQFEVSDMYTQINYQDKIVRVTPLEYANLIKYFTNRSKGVSGYIKVNSVTGESELVRLEKGIKYTNSALFFEDLNRKLRISYPTTIFGDVNFEIDDDGHPYWIAEVIKYAGVGLRREVSGVVILDPITGESKKYNVGEEPTWVDHVYSADLIMEELDDWGTYKNGFLNSLFGQKEVKVTTDGYNYLAMNNDVYMYTGITSVSNDASNIGFVLTNLRTKETHFYDVAGASETAAMGSAEGQVQQMQYDSTFPLLINLNNKPTYLVSLKDNEGLVKMYGFIDYTDYQKVVVSDASLGIEKAALAYSGDVIDDSDTKWEEIFVEEISVGVINGNTYYYIKDRGSSYKVKLSVKENILPFLKVGDRLNIGYREGLIREIIEIK